MSSRVQILPRIFPTGATFETPLWLNRALLLKWTFTWLINASSLLLLHQKGSLKYVFLHISKPVFQRLRCTFWVCFRWVFNIFHWTFKRVLPGNQAKRCDGEFLCSASFRRRSYDYSSEENGCFITTQSLTAHQSNQNFPALCVSRRHCNVDCALLLKSDRKQTWLVNFCTLVKRVLQSENLSFLIFNQ